MSDNNEKKDVQECGYCCLTFIALSIAIFSAFLTLLIASSMYHGVHEHSEMPKEIMSSSIKRLLVPHKKVIMLRMENQNRCYILSLNLAQELATAKFSFFNVPLDKDVLRDVAGDDGIDFCSTLPAYVLEKSPNSP